MKKIFIISTAFIIIVLIILLIFSYYNHIAIKPISFDQINREPEILIKENIFYFDNFDNEELVKYIKYLNENNFTNISNLNDKVIAIANLINNIHNLYLENSAKAENQFPDFLIIKSNGSYCQQSSILLALMLSSIDIYSRQIHLSDQNNIGYHQFIEYYNYELNKWIVVDTFYGVQYEKNHNLLSLGELINEIIKGDKIKNLEKHNLYGSYPVQDEKNWQNKVLISRANDYTIIKNPEINYGFFGKFSFIDKLPENIRRIFRIFGRNNSMYEIFNYKSL